MLPKCILLFISAVVLGVHGRAWMPSRVQAGMRQLLQEELATGIRVADFSDLSENLSAEVYIGEKQLKGTINISASSSEQVSYGTYYLGPDQVRQLNDTISVEMVCSSIARVVSPVQW